MEVKIQYGEEMLGEQQPAKESYLHSPKKGVPILDRGNQEGSVIKALEEMLGLRSWMENI